MRLKTVISLLLVITIGISVTAQDKGTPDGDKPIDETKLLLGELFRLGDPDINKMLPDLYRALKATEGEVSSSSTPRTASSQMPNVMSMLRNPSVRHEIEMLDEQYEDVQEKHGRIVHAMNEQIRALLSAQSDADPYGLREEIGAIRAEAEEEVEKAVLPFQFERLRQLRYHVLMRRLGPVNVLTNDPLAAELDISEEQKKELRQSAREIDEELEREIARLRSQAMAKLFSRLKKNQQIKLSEIIGGEFHYQDVDWKMKQRGASKASAEAKRR